MRHRKATLKLNRTSSHRKAMFRNMVTSLFKYDRIKTTDTRAKELRKWADHVITLAKRGDLHARRQALAIVREKNVVHKLFAEASERFGNISGGYTRIIKIGRRPGDTAPISLIELVVASEKSKEKKKKKKEPEKQAVPEKAEVSVAAEQAQKEIETTVQEAAPEEAPKQEETDTTAQEAAAPEEAPKQEETDTTAQEAAAPEEAPKQEETDTTAQEAAAPEEAPKQERDS